MTKAKYMMRSLGSLLVAGIIVGGLSAHAFAQDTADDNDRLDEAWQDALGDQEPILKPQQFALLNNLAFQAAVPKICKGYDIDGEKFAKDFANATTPPNTSMSADEQKQWEAAVLVRFGTTYGLFLAEGNTKSDDFCKSAAELKADTSTSNVWK